MKVKKAARMGGEGGKERVEGGGTVTVRQTDRNKDGCKE